ncbi:hypothetical protein JCM19239_6812 [Vibrio variabilis]|uniref:Uncharacterized protein n=1 Tax=Vibrio variabilis TaxID=990271 RepID=A0ABQ0JN28_9VIBR|nr:hypothetical protein JCM19239_6812 [Vibrio variabilis]
MSLFERGNGWAVRSNENARLVEFFGNRGGTDEHQLRFSTEL